MDKRSIIKHSDYKKIAVAAKDGNQVAKAILESYLKKSPQADIDRIIKDFYDQIQEPSSSKAVEIEKKIEEPDDEEFEEFDEDDIDEDEDEDIDDEDDKDDKDDKDEESEEEGEPKTLNPTSDISADLDKDLDGVLDKNEIAYMSFRDFIKNKKRDALRKRKNHDHFSAYDHDGRENYIASKSDEYGSSFDHKRKDIDRHFRDLDGAIDGYVIFINEMPNDGIEPNEGVISELYDRITDDDGFMGGFGRSWDIDDDAALKETLKSLVPQYGKKNVLKVLDALKRDNKDFHEFRHGQIDQETKRYAKSLEDLLK